MAAAQTASVVVSTRRMPQTPIQRLVTGPAIAWPIEVAAEHEAGRAVRAGDVLDVQQDREARHAVREPRGQLRGDDPRDAGRAKKIPVAGHPSTLSRAGRRHAVDTPRHADAPQADRMSEPRAYRGICGWMWPRHPKSA